MKILYFYQYFSTPRGCWGTRAYEFARRWAAAGHEITIVTSVYDKSDLRPKTILARDRIEGIDVLTLNIPLSNKHGKAVRIASFLSYAALASLICLFREADVVLASSGPITVGLPALIARHVRKRPVVFEVRDLWPEGAIQLGIISHPIVVTGARLLERECYRAASTIVPLSDGMAQWIYERYGTDRLSVVPNASDLELFGTAKPIELPYWARGKKIVLYAGTLGQMNDSEQLVELASVLRRWRKDKYEVVVIGDGRDRADLERECERRNLSNIRFLGMRPKTEVAGWLQHAVCSLLVFRNLPFLDTVSPNKLFDAFAAGVPVVQTTQGWIKTLLAGEQCGFTVPPNDASAMAHAVCQLGEDRCLRDKLAENARRVAKERFDRQLLAEKMLRILERACASAS